MTRLRRMKRYQYGRKISFLGPVIALWAMAALAFGTFLVHRSAVGLVDKHWVAFQDNDDTTAHGWSPAIHQRRNAVPTNRLQRIPRTNHSSLNAPIKVLWGIMSHNLDPDQATQRQLRRDTYLSYYKDHHSGTPREHWICSIDDLIHGKLQHPDLCRLAYAFVLGGNPNGPQMLLSYNDSYPLTVDIPGNESDLIYLNIQENGRYGKSPTWFNYASSINNGDFAYIFKTDIDNLLFPSQFFDSFVDSKLPKTPVRVYGGTPKNKKGCGGDKHDHCRQLVGPIFNGGGCYFLSADLAQFISNSNSFDHYAVKLPHEDMTTGNFVFRHPLKIKTISDRQFKYRKHPIKDPVAYQQEWDKYLQKIQK